MDSPTSFQNEVVEALKDLNHTPEPELLYNVDPHDIKGADCWSQVNSPFQLPGQGLKLQFQKGKTSCLVVSTPRPFPDAEG